MASGDAKLFNKASQVALVRDGDRTVLTMANDYRGDPKDFAMVIPVPTPITEPRVTCASAASAALCFPAFPAFIAVRSRAHDP